MSRCSFRFPLAKLLYRHEGLWYWRPVADLLTGRSFADPSLFRFDDRWWLFAGNTGSNTCWLYFSDDLTDPEAWVEHPSSPIVPDDRSRARPAGRVLTPAEDRIVRLAQDSSVSYGKAVRAFEVLALDENHYAEQELPESPILQGDSVGWNRLKMHHCDAWWTGEYWLAAVDGWSMQWQIGIYANALSAAPPLPGRGDLLTFWPSPWREGDLHVRLAMPVAPGTRITLCDIRGREVAAMAPRRFDRNGAYGVWNASAGAALAGGLYLLRVEGLRTKETAAKIVVLH